MTAPAIRAIGLSKRFRIGERVRYKSLRESIQNAVTAPFRRGRRSEETIWALRDVSFEVTPGEVVGVIGRNGAGKSTLLKVLSRITEPTEGRVELRGRVGSLLEVGTGFHLELTGRENIYLNGAILGMKRTEIARRFDEIVAFAEVERFVDTPVKHYSTGMYLRLAFAVAAHLEPEILLIDEVLAVGDASFQKKCLGRMGEAARGGRAVLFVSHDLGAVEHLCSRAVLLEQGKVALEGAAPGVVNGYLEGLRRTSPESGRGRWTLDGCERPAGMKPVLRGVTIWDDTGAPTATVRTGAKVVFTIDYDNKGNTLVNPHFALRVEASNGQPLIFFRTRIQGPVGPSPLPPSGTVTCTVDRLPLAPGNYALTVGLTEREAQLDLVEGRMRFSVAYGDFFGTGQLPDPAWGPVLVNCTWRLPGLEPMIVSAHVDRQAGPGKGRQDGA
ncbi:MAG: ABC transporter ATP-binding protein [Acidobacteriia bacterium]|nr:ABC transporter ATP-binding protein [Terriglobia bacterium]